MDDGEGGFGEGGDPMDQFHHNEAISAVVDEGFLAEEDDDYEDLYNDVNVGEGFLQSLRKNEDLGFKHEEEKKIESQAVASNPGVSIPDVAGGGGSGEVTGSRPDDVSRTVVKASEGHSKSQVGGNEVVMRGGIGSGGPSGGGGGMRVELGQGNKMNIPEEQSSCNVVGAQGIGQCQPPQQQPQPPQPPQQQPHVGAVGNVNGVGMRNGAVNVVNTVGGNGGGGGGGTILFVGDLHWWTTDAELESELCRYGVVKEVKFFDEKASGKSKGYCQVEFYDPNAATSCKEGMNGHMFNGRPCVVAYASPFSVKRMGEAQVNRNQQGAPAGLAQARRVPNDTTIKPGGSNIATGGNYQGGDTNNNNNNNNNNNRGFGRGNWGRGNAQGMGGRGAMGQMRGRGVGMGGRGLMGNGGNGFGQGLGATPPMMHPQAMMGQGFDPGFGGPMGRMGNYGGFPGAPMPPFSGILSSFPPVGGVGLPAPHVNPAFFGRGMPMNGMGMMPPSGVDGSNMGMWSDPSMGGWVGEEHGGGRAAESSYGEEAASDHQYGEVGHDRVGWPNAVKDKDAGSERDWSGSSDRRYRDDREPGYDRDVPREKDVGPESEWSERKHREVRDVGRERERERSRDRDRGDRDRDRDREKYKEERDRYAEHHRYREREREHDDEWEGGRSSKSHSKSRISQEDEHRSRSRDADYGKRRRLTSE